MDRGAERCGGAWSCSLVAGLLLLAWAQQAHGQQDARTLDRAAAQSLFDEGKRLSKAGKYPAACPKLAESYRLDPAVGTQFYLGDCYENIGRLASAWIQFVDVAATARRRGQPVREGAARRRAQRLYPRLTRLLVAIKQRVPGLRIFRNGTALPMAQWGSAIPVDAGEYRLVAKARGYRSWRKVVVARREGQRVRIEVPALHPLKLPQVGGVAAEATEQAEPTSRRDTVRKVRLGTAIGLGVLGIAGVGLGSAQGVIAIDKKAESEPFCRLPAGCFEEGLRLRSEARRAASLSTVSFGVAAGAIIGATILWLTLPTAREPAQAPKKARSGWVLVPGAGDDSPGAKREGAWLRKQADPLSLGLSWRRFW